MKNSFNHFLAILADNSYPPKYKDIPEYVDNRDEIIAELQEILDDDGHLPDSMRYFCVNGKTTASEITDYLEKSFQQFRTEFLSENHGANHALRTELLTQLDSIKKSISQVVFETKQIGDETLNAMMDVKLQFCNEVIYFVVNTQNISKISIQDKGKQDRHSFKWLKGDDRMLEFFNKMKSNKLIASNTHEDDFRAVFSSVPVKEIENPVQWEKGAKLFTYFFMKLIENKNIPKSPTWVILEHFFTYDKEGDGRYVPIQQGIKGNRADIKELGAPKGAELVDVLFDSEKDHI